MDSPIDIQGLEFIGFKSEREMCDYLEHNIKLFTKDILNANYLSHEREHIPTGRRPFGAKRSCVDFLITTDDGKRTLVEVKNPKHIYSEMLRSVSQLLGYGALADLHEPVDKLILVTSNTSGVVQMMIAKYELPIEVVIMNRDILATWNREWHSQWQDQQNLHQN